MHVSMALGSYATVIAFNERHKKRVQVTQTKKLSSYPIRIIEQHRLLDLIPNFTFKLHTAAKYRLDTNFEDDNHSQDSDSFCSIKSYSTSSFSS